MQPTKIFFTTKATASGGPSGYTETEDGVLKLKLDKPKELGGKGDGTNPEQIFAAGYAACFLSALHFVAGKRNVNVDGATVTAEAGFGSIGEGFIFTATLYVKVPGLSLDDAKKIAEEAHHVCPFSNSTRGSIDVKLEVSV